MKKVARIESIRVGTDILSVGMDVNVKDNPSYGGKIKEFRVGTVIPFLIAVRLHNGRTVWTRAEQISEAEKIIRR